METTVEAVMEITEAAEEAVGKNRKRLFGSRFLCLFNIFVNCNNLKQKNNKKIV